MTNLKTKQLKILGTGSALPSKILTNADLEKIVDTSNEWILERTGIKERRISSEEGENCSDLATKAAIKALESANLKPNDIDLILCASITPDYRIPSASSIIQRKLGITNECPCLDIAAACSGFVYGMSMADAFIKTGVYKKILLIGAELLSRITNWDDRTSCVLFADGAGAVVLGESDNEDSRIISSHLSCDGTGGEFLICEAGGSAIPSTNETIAAKKEMVQMEGRQVFKYATRTMINNAKKILEDAKMTNKDLHWFIPHQANMRIIEYLSDKLDIGLDRIVVTIDKYGNNSSATIPIALDEAVRDGRIKRGQLIAMDAFGSGVTSGAILFRF